MNGNPSDNRLTNLCWGTHVENAADQVRHGTDSRGERNGQARFSLEEVRKIRQQLAEGAEGGALAKVYGVSIATISRIKNNIRYRDG